MLRGRSRISRRSIRAPDGARELARGLTTRIFDSVFPGLARSIAAAAPASSLPDVRDAALVLLYRLLFILSAEDRRLLPAGDPRRRE